MVLLAQRDDLRSSTALSQGLKANFEMGFTNTDPASPKRQKPVGRTVASGLDDETLDPGAPALTRGSLAPARSRMLEAVVSDVMRDFVIVSCRLPDQEVEIRLPSDVVPPELQSYGQPVFVSLSEERGYRAPKVTERFALPRQQNPEELAIQSWLNNL
jgi:hypothetical protein